MRLATDTLVIGAGSAGCVLAEALSREGEVLLVEAGPDYAGAQLPADLRDGTRNSYHAHDWGLRHRPSTQQPLVFPLPRGRVVGGSSAVNTCIALRGVPEDYEDWVLRGLPEWGWADCLPAFRALERDLDFGDQPGHGADGPLPIRRHPAAEQVPWQAAFLEAADHLGLPACPDHNAPGATGAGPHPMNKLQGRRVSAAEAWLRPEVRARPGLRILPNTRALKLLFSGDAAVGLLAQRGAEALEIRARRLVLCLGAHHTPGLLLRSGVGPEATLARLGVPAVSVNAAVGARLLDHPGAAMFLLPRWRIMNRAAPLIQNALRLASADARGHPADLQLQPGSFLATPQVDIAGAVSLMVGLGTPRGHGELFWPSADPGARPQVNSRLLEHPEDRARAVEGMALAYALSQTPPMRALARPLLPWRRALRSPARIARWIRLFCDSGYHPCGTVPMGPEGDPEAATDGRGRVRGLRGLWVADASLFPSIPSPNIHLPTLMVATRIAGWLAAEEGGAV